MKNPKTFEEQTECIMNALFDEFSNSGGHRVANRMSTFDETDSGGACSFDVAPIVGRLKELGDKLNEELTKKLTDRAQNIIEDTSLGQEEKTNKLQEVLESLSKTWYAQDPGLVYERAFLELSMKLMKLVTQRFHEMRTQLTMSLTNIINGNLQQYIQGQGGWENLEI